MNRRTNIIEKITGYVCRLIIPALLLLALSGFGDVKSLFENILKAGAFLTAEKTAVEENEIYNSISVNENKEQNSEDLENPIPEDVRKLMAEAEVKYADTSADGKITEEDLSTKNATARYDKVYIRNTTVSHEIDIGKYLNGKISANIVKEDYSVLIYHTHTSESFQLIDREYYSNSIPCVSDNKGENIVRVGTEICRILEENGYKTIHITDSFDEQYGGAYDRSREKISEILLNNPSIQIVLDIHRDCIYKKDGTRVKPVTLINNRKAAQIMITAGCEDGNVTNFPNWEKNLTFALQLQKSITDKAPSLMRPVTVASRKYNMDLVPCALTAEFGTDANTLAETVYSAHIFAECLVNFLEEN